MGRSSETFRAVLRVKLDLFAEVPNTIPGTYQQLNY